MCANAHSDLGGSGGACPPRNFLPFVLSDIDSDPCVMFHHTRLHRV